MTYQWLSLGIPLKTAGRRAAKLGGLWAPGGDLPRKRGAGDQWGAEGSERSGGPGRAGDGPGMSWLHNGLTYIVYFYVLFLYFNMFKHAVFLVLCSLYMYIYIYAGIHNWTHTHCVLFSQSQSQGTPHSTRMGLDELGPLANIAGEDRNFVLGITWSTWILSFWVSWASLRIMWVFMGWGPGLVSLTCDNTHEVHELRTLVLLNLKPLIPAEFCYWI